MRRAFLLSILLLLPAAGCDYKAPLTEEHVIAVDPAVMGEWEEVMEASDANRDPERVVVMPFSPTEYVVHYYDEELATYFRAYPIEIGGIRCVQLEYIGPDRKEAEKEGESLYHVVSYRLEKGELVARKLNKDLVDTDLGTPEELVKAFLAHKDSPDLFTDPIRFRKAGSSG